MSALFGLIQPELWYYEVANGITIAVRRNRISENQGKAFIEELQAIPVKLYNIVPIIKKAYKEAIKFKYTVYDMVYLSTAESENIQLISGDEKLVNAVKDSKSFVTHISNIRKIIQ